MTREDREHTQIDDTHRLVTDLDKRVTVLETRADAQASEMKEMQKDVRENKDLSMKILDTVRVYRDEDAKERRKLLVGIITTLVTVIGTLVATLLY